MDTNDRDYYTRCGDNPAGRQKGYLISYECEGLFSQIFLTAESEELAEAMFNGIMADDRFLADDEFEITDIIEYDP